MSSFLKNHDRSSHLGWQQKVWTLDAVRNEQRVCLSRDLDQIQDILMAQQGVPDDACIKMALVAVSAFRAELTRPLIRKDVLQQLLKTIRLVSAASPLVAEVRQKVARVY
jgi:hypothetical protein